MSKIKGKIKETAGHAEEELGEATRNARLASKGRKLRNEGLVEAGKAPKTKPVGTEKVDH